MTSQADSAEATIVALAMFLTGVALGVALFGLTEERILVCHMSHGLPPSYSPSSSVLGQAPNIPKST